MLEEAGIEPQPVAPKVLLPILENASLEDDEELHDRRAALLANAADPGADVGVEAVFPDILRQLSRADAIFLDAVYDRVRGTLERDFGGPAVSATLVAYVQLGDTNCLLMIFAELGLTKLEGHTNLLRNQLLRPALDDAGSDSPLYPNVPKRRTAGHFLLTPLGYEFLRACRSPASRRPSGPGGEAGL